MSGSQRQKTKAKAAHQAEVSQMKGRLFSFLSAGHFREGDLTTAMKTADSNKSSEMFLCFFALCFIMCSLCLFSPASQLLYINKLS